MSNIRRQSIISSIIVYFGFAMGFVNTYLFTKEGHFTETQYGLIQTFLAIAQLMCSVAALGMQSYIYKFYPYYNDNLEPKKNDMISFALLTCITGFILVSGAGIVLKDLVVRKYSTNAPELIKFYYWLFPFGLGLTVYSVLEAYGWQLKKSVLTNYLREVQFRLFTTILIILFYIGILPYFDDFVKIYSLTYLLLALILFLYLLIKKKIYLTLKPSRVTKKFLKKILALCAFVWSGGLVFNLAQVFDTLVLAAVLQNGFAFVAIYSLAQNMSSLIQAPQRGIISAAIAPLSKAWKDKDFNKIQQIYYRSSINQLLFSVGMFLLIVLNFNDGILTFNLRDTYLNALPVFLLIGLMRILDMGTGLNAQIIATSIYWRFEFFTGIILISLVLPLNYFLTKTYGVIGPAIANLISFTIYNTIRCVFLYRKYKMTPFSIKSLYTVLLGLAVFALCYFLFNDRQGFLWIVIRSSMFIILYSSAAFLLKISPDLYPVLLTIGDKLRVRKRK